MDALQLTLRAELRRRQRNMRITGTAVLASVNRGGFDSTDLGNGAVLAPPVLSQPNLSSGTIPVTVALAMLIAAWPGRTAARVRPAAAALRAE